MTDISRGGRGGGWGTEVTPFRNIILIIIADVDLHRKLIHHFGGVSCLKQSVLLLLLLVVVACWLLLCLKIIVYIRSSYYKAIIYF